MPVRGRTNLSKVTFDLVRGSVPLVGADRSLAVVQQPPAALLDSRLRRWLDVRTVAQCADETGDDSLPSTDNQRLAGGGVESNTVGDILLVPRESSGGQPALTSHRHPGG